MEMTPVQSATSKVRFESLEHRRLLSAAAAGETVSWAGVANVSLVEADGTSVTGSIASIADGTGGLIRLVDGTTFQAIPATGQDGEGAYVLHFVGADGSPIASQPAPAPEPLAAPTPATRSEADMEMPLGTVVQDDGKVLVATLVGVRPTGAAANSTQQTFDRVALVRYLADGSIDTSFGVDGYSTYALAESVTSDWWPGAVAVDADGGILVAHYHGINRFLADGTIDASFGTNGTLSVESLEQMKVAPDGKILVITGDDMIYRYDADGTADSTFAPYQLQVPGSKWQYADIEDVAAGADGSVYLVGEIRTANADPLASKMTNAFLAKLNADGTPDTTFADNGRFELATPGRKWEAFRGVTVLADGKIQIVGGYDELVDPGVYPVPRGALLARFNADGTPDASYGTGGIVDAPGITISATRGTLVLADGTVVASTYGKNGAAVLVANADGSDAHLVEQAVTLANGNLQQETTTYAPTLAPDGTIVVAVGVANIWSEATAGAAETYWTRIDLDAPPAASNPPAVTAGPEDEVDAPAAEPTEEPVADEAALPSDEGATAAPQVAAVAPAAATTRSPFWFAIADPSKDDLLAPAADGVIV